jgi:hypothetical protein
LTGRRAVAMIAVGATFGPMRYFCYISRRKIDDLYGQLEPGALDEIAETETAERTIDGHAEAGLNVAGVMSLFKGGVTYGRKGVIQTERKVKASYTDRLYRVLRALAEEKPIPPLGSVLSGAEPSARYCHYTGPFSVTARQAGDTIVTLESETEGHRVVFDCSVRFFSESTDDDGQLHPHSGNVRFFSGELALTLRAVFVLMAIQDSTVFGSPLFLELPDPDPWTAL